MSLVRRTRLLWAGVCATILHAALLIVADEAGQLGAPSSTASSGSPAAVSREALLSSPAPTWQLVRRQEAGEEQPTSAPTAPPLGADATPELALDVRTRELPATGAPPEAPYWRRQDVDQGPVPLGPIAIPYPDGVFINKVVQGKVTLYIDEQGMVRRVQARDTSLPPAMVQAVRDAFLQARFQPALRQQIAVRVQLDIEVQFDPSDAPAGNRSLASGMPGL